MLRRYNYSHPLYTPSLNLTLCIGLLPFIIYLLLSITISRIFMWIWDTCIPSFIKHLFSYHHNKRFFPLKVYGGMNEKNILMTIKQSHYCERSRFALTLLQSYAQQLYEHHVITYHTYIQYTYEERSHPVVLHIFWTFWYSGGKHREAPLLLSSAVYHHQRVSGSDKIMLYVDHCMKQLEEKQKQHHTQKSQHTTLIHPSIQLYPSRQTHPEQYYSIVRSDHILSYKFAIAVRAYIYIILLNKQYHDRDIQKYVRYLFLKDCSNWIERTIMYCIYPWIHQFLIWELELDLRNELIYKDLVDKTFDNINELLSDGRQYIMDTTRPSAVDLTFASLAYPLVYYTEIESLIGERRQRHIGTQLYHDIKHYRKTLAGKHAIKIYSTLRGGNVQV